MKMDFTETMKQIADRIGLDSIAATPKVIASAMADLGLDEMDIALMRTVVNSAAAKPLMQMIVAMQGTAEEYHAQKKLLMDSAFLGEAPASKVLTGLWAMRGMDAGKVVGETPNNAAQEQPSRPVASAYPEHSRRDDMRPTPVEIPRPQAQTASAREVPRPRPVPQHQDPVVEQPRVAQNTGADDTWGHGTSYKLALYFWLWVATIGVAVSLSNMLMSSSSTPNWVAMILIVTVLQALLAVCRVQDRKKGRTWLRAGQLFAGSTISKVGVWKFVKPFLFLLLTITCLVAIDGGETTSEVWILLLLVGAYACPLTILGYMKRAHEQIPKSEAR